MMQLATGERRNIIVTGGTSGLGRVIAAGFAEIGWDVIICARTQADCLRVATGISAAHPGSCTGIACDLSNQRSLDEFVREVGARFGALHTLVNNAGAVAPGPLESIGEADWDRVVDVNLKAAFFLAQKLTPNLRQGASADWPASIINIGSFAGARIGPQPHYPYSAAKAGLNSLTQALAKGLASDRINVNTIALGVFPEDSAILRDYSEQTLDSIRRAVPAGRLGEGRDIVALTRFLASPSCSYITGANIPLDGGMHV